MRDDDRKRLSRFIEQDREGMNRESKEAALRDFTHVAGEFFELSGNVELTIVKEKKHFDVTVRFKADRVKNFTSIQ